MQQQDASSHDPVEFLAQCHKSFCCVESEDGFEFPYSAGIEIQEEFFHLGTTLAAFSAESVQSICFGSHGKRRKTPSLGMNLFEAQPCSIMRQRGILLRIKTFAS